MLAPIRNGNDHLRSAFNSWKFESVKGGETSILCQLGVFGNVSHLSEDLKVDVKSLNMYLQNSKMLKVETSTL
ncbi:expressed protein [Echinococcus multilocularis]|uniref:Expressed protein n=1 Tax=Echinococcus multilocularis TaxID=6211 RepID=A0A068Y5E3_ECHMU|nr:expressed protein [Echinococcus multilocularis]